MENVCEVCGKGFEARPNRVAQGKDRFCSIACRGAGRRTRVTRECEACGKGFEADQCRVAKGGGRFCSKTCKDAGQRKSVTRKCEQCGKGFEARPNRVAQGKDRFCSKACVSARKKTQYRLFGGQVVTVPEIARLTGKNAATVRGRLNRGWMGAVRLPSNPADV